MTTPGSRPRKGWLSSFQAAMAPVPPEDDGAPIIRPLSVKIAVGFAVAAGVIFLFFGGLSLASAGTQADSFKSFYVSAVKQCTQQVGGIGTVVPSALPTPLATSTTDPIASKDLLSTCKQLTTTEPTADQLNSYKTSVILFSVVIVLLGLASGVAGWFLRNGAKWARRVLVGASIVALALAALFQVSNTFTLLATLLIVVALVLCYIGKGGLYFARLAQRRKAH